MQKVIGVGGVFFKAKDPQKLMEWYDQNLGIKFNYGYFEFKWVDEPGNKAPGSTTFAIFKEDAKDFNPSEKPFMINLRVADLRGLLAELREKSITVGDDKDIEEADYGRFGWVMDPEGNKLQLWEPADASGATK